MSSDIIDDVILFWKPDEKPYGILSNYYPINIIIDNKQWNSTESYYQSEKFTDEWYKEQIRLTKTPHQSKMLGTMSVSHYSWADNVNKIINIAIEKNIKIRSDWDDIKDEIMEKALNIKFKHMYPQKVLLLTKNKPICENSPYDYYWGIGKNGTGKNKLGKLLMNIRSEINDV